jgi:hypothetical protein
MRWPKTQFNDIIGVSKRSCPTCVELLTFLRNMKQFHVTGAHQNFSVCSLPPSIPPSVMEDMVHKFSMHLKSAIHRLHQLPPVPAPIVSAPIVPAPNVPAPTVSAPTNSTPTDSIKGKHKQRVRTESIESHALSISSNNGSRQGSSWIWNMLLTAIHNSA